MQIPRYSYPLRLLPGLIARFISGGERSFRLDAIACIRKLKPALRVLGVGNVPTSGPCVLTTNHYHRPGFGAWWMAFALASIVPVEMQWVMTGELTFPGKWYAPLGRPASRWLLARLAKIYHFITMPPMPPREKDVAARARSVRAVLEYIHQHPRSMLGVAPEGADHPGGVLTWPPKGVGRFLFLLAEAGFSFIPVGCWEEQGALCLRAGTAYRLSIPPDPSTEDKDHLAAEMVMRNIASQLPDYLRGEFNLPATQP